MARRRRRRGSGHRVPWGADRPSWPPDPEDVAEGALDWSDEPDEGPGWLPPDAGLGHHPPGAGGASVREPRRPKPTVPGMSAELEPEPDTFVDLSDPARS